MSECGLLQPFLDAGKPIFNVEYANTKADALEKASSLCPIAITEKIRTLVLPLNLDDTFASAATNPDAGWHAFFGWDPPACAHGVGGPMPTRLCAAFSGCPIFWAWPSHAH